MNYFCKNHNTIIYDTPKWMDFDRSYEGRLEISYS